MVIAIGNDIEPIWRQGIRYGLDIAAREYGYRVSGRE
jgi:hypothetical protein